MTKAATSPKPAAAFDKHTSETNFNHQIDYQGYKRGSVCNERQTGF
jgi:hypothetical protein